MTDSLSRLRARLDRDEAIARAAAERASEWRSDGNGVAGGPFEPRPDWLGADEEWTVPESGTHTIVYDEGWPLASEARHIARQDPKATLDRVEAIRKVIAEREAEHTRVQVSDPVVRAYGDGYRAAYDRIAGILASIYAPEPTDETEKP